MSAKVTSKDVQYNLIENTAAVVILNGKSYMIQASDSRFKPVVDAIKKSEFDKLPDLLDLAAAVVNYMHGSIEVKNGGVFWKGQELHGLVIDKVLEALGTSKDYSERLIKFIDKLYQNPSRRSVEQLYKFLEHKGLALAEDGDVFGYKGLQENYQSISSGKEPVEISLDGGKTWVVHTGSIPNKIGSIIRMPRNLVMDDPSIGCHVGLHIGSLNYATNFARGRVVIVKFNPANAVSVPNDCNCEKLRACEYTVVGDFKGELPSFGVDTDSLYDDDDYDDDYYDEDEDMS